MTVTNGLIDLDPINGLVDFVNTIKPYHSKIFQVLVEYVYTDNVNTTVIDTFNLNINDNQTYISSAIDPAIENEGGIPAGSFWYNLGSNILYVRGNYLNPTFYVATAVLTLAGDYTQLFTPGFVFNISGTGTFNDGDYSVFQSTFDGTNTEISVSPSFINNNPGAIDFFPVTSSTGTYYYNGSQLFLVTGTNQTLIPNVLISTSMPTYGSVAAYWYNPSTNFLYTWTGSSYTFITLQAGILGYWIPIESKLSQNPNQGTNVDTTVTEFIETIAFGWSGNYSYPIVSTNLTNNQVSISGNLAKAIMVQDITQIDSTISEVTAVIFDPSTNTTVITMAAVPSSVIVNTLIIQDVDITYWYEFQIISVNPTPTAPSQSPLSAARTSTNSLILSIYSNVVVPSITVAGDATTSVQVGALFQIQGSASNNGQYYAVYVQYEPIANTTTIGVSSTTGIGAPVLTATGGGSVIPYRFVDQVSQGSYDNGSYDTGPFDESAGSIIYQGP